MGIYTKRFIMCIMVVGIIGAINATFAHLSSGRTLNLKTVPSSKISRYTFTKADAEEWTKDFDKTGGYVVKYGEFEGTTLYWTNAWWAGPSDIPGEFVDSGGTSPWALINSKAFTEGSEYQWVGWNSNSGKWEISHDDDWVFTETQIGTWGNQIDSKTSGAHLPTWRDGAEGCYTMIHDDIGAMEIESSVQPANEVGAVHNRIRVAWGVKTDAMDSEEWKIARGMVIAGHEMVNHSYDHTSASDQWQWFFKGDVLPNNDPSIPKQIMNLTVADSNSGSYTPITFDVPYIDYVGGDVTKPDTLYITVTFQVADYTYIVDSTYNSDWGEWEYEYNSTGKIKAEHEGWNDLEKESVDMLKIYCVPGWTANRKAVNVGIANGLINKHVYDQVNSSRFPAGKQCEYYVYPYDAYSNETHNYLYDNGIIASRGGAKSGTPIPGDFFHPFRIDFDAFFMLDANATTIYPDNPHQRISLDGLVDRISKSKGYMIREFHACANVSDWNDANDQEKGGWWGGIPKSLYETHFVYLDQLIDEHKITVATPTEAVCYRITANSVTDQTLTDNGTTASVTVTASGCNSKYQDEISVIIFMSSPWLKMASKYADGTITRYQPRQMDKEGKAWSVSVNPYEQGGVVNLTQETILPVSSTKDVNFKTASITNVTKKSISFSAPIGAYNLNVYNMNGKILVNQSVVSNGIAMNIKFNNELATGQYIFDLSGKVNIRTKMMVR